MKNIYYVVGSTASYKNQFITFTNKSFISVLNVLKNKLVGKFFKNKYSKSFLPKFEGLFDFHIKDYTEIKPSWTYRNNIFWTPQFYIQNDICFEFLQELKKFKKIKNLTSIDQLAILQLILIEATRDTTYKIDFKYECKSTSDNIFHGDVDIILYNSCPESYGIPTIPINISTIYYSNVFSEWLEQYNDAKLVGQCLYFLKETQIKTNFAPEYNFVRGFHTNGHDWKLFEVHNTNVKKTKFFKPSYQVKANTEKCYFRPYIYDDINYIKTIIGLIRFAMSKFLL